MEVLLVTHFYYEAISSNSNDRFRFLDDVTPALSIFVLPLVLNSNSATQRIDLIRSPVILCSLINFFCEYQFEKCGKLK